MTLATSAAAARGVNLSTVSASDTGRPTTVAATSRALRGVRRTPDASACTSIPSFFLLERRAALGVMAVSAELAGHGELAELVPDHRLRDEHGDVLAAVVDADRQPDHLREDVAAARPGLDDPLLAGGLQLLHLLEEVLVAERAFLRASAHCSLLPGSLLGPTPN